MMTMQDKICRSRALKPIIDHCHPLEAMIEAHRYFDMGYKKGKSLSLWHRQDEQLPLRESVVQHDSQGVAIPRFYGHKSYL